MFYGLGLQVGDFSSLQTLSVQNYCIEFPTLELEWMNETGVGERPSRRLWRWNGIKGWVLNQRDRCECKEGSWQAQTKWRHRGKTAIYKPGERSCKKQPCQPLIPDVQTPAPPTPGEKMLLCLNATPPENLWYFVVTSLASKQGSMNI